MATPAFMSSVPGPHRRPSLTRQGMRLERAQRPDRIEMARAAERAPAVFDVWPEARFQHIAKRPLPVQLDPASQRFGMRRNQCDAGVHGGLVVGRRLGATPASDQLEQRGLLCAALRPAARAWEHADSDSETVLNGFIRQLSGNFPILRPSRMPRSSCVQTRHSGRCPSAPHVS